ncbi:MAG: DNA methyltransferase, partial [Alphaproteobacteria bacterium]
SSSNPGDLVLDPFFGTGTTGAVAAKLGRDWLGIEADPGYAEIAEARMRDARPLAEAELLATPSKRREPRVPFGAVVERGLINPGAVVVDRSRRFAAKVRADGTLASGRIRGSIHHVAAELQGLTTCNGWTWWHFEDDGALAPIDLMRQRIRAELEGGAVVALPTAAVRRAEAG